MSNEDPDPRPRELVADEWRALDDSLADGPSPASVPDDAKVWLAEQRVMHGLLRALHTADAGAREGRILGLLAAIDSSRVSGMRRHRALVGVAAALLAIFALWLWLPDRLPTAEAAVDRIVSQMRRDVDRRYRVEVRVIAAGRGTEAEREKARHVFSLVTRPGMRFRVEGKFAFLGLEAGELRVGCDGEELWVLPNRPWMRRAAPLAEREKLLSTLGDVLDTGYLDVNALIAKLPEAFVVRVVGREVDAAGRKLLRVEAEARRDWNGRLRAAWLLCDEATGMVHHVEIRGVGGLGLQRRLILDYLGEEPPGLIDYSKPW